MMKLESIVPGGRLTGILGDEPVEVVATRAYGPDAVEVTYKGPDGLAQRILYRDDEPGLGEVAPTRRFAFDGDGRLFRLVSEALRIRLAYLFDPYVAVSGGFTVSVGSMRTGPVAAPAWARTRSSRPLPGRHKPVRRACLHSINSIQHAAGRAQAALTAAASVATEDAADRCAFPRHMTRGTPEISQNSTWGPKAARKRIRHEVRKSEVIE